MKLSIIVPVYNIAEDFLRQCLDSLSRQTIDDYEVIVVDDGSEEACRKFCDEYGEKQNNFFVLHQENAGVSAARNAGIDKAVGEYVQFVDADDWLEEDASRRYYEYASNNNLDVLLSGCQVVGGQVLQPVHFESTVLDASDIRRLQLTILNNDPQYLDMWPMSPWAKLFRTKFLRENGLKFVPELKRMQDNVFCLYALGKAGRVGYFHAQDYYYRQNGDSVCHKYNSGVVSVLEPVLREFARYIREYRADDKAFQNAYYVKGIIILTTDYTRLYFLNENNPLHGRERLAEFKKLCNRDPYCKMIEGCSLQDCHRMYRVYAFLLKKKMYAVLWCLFILHKRYRRE